MRVVVMQMRSARRRIATIAIGVEAVSVKGSRGPRALRN